MQDEKMEKVEARMQDNDETEENEKRRRLQKQLFETNKQSGGATESSRRRQPKAKDRILMQRCGTRGVRNPKWSM